MTQSLSERASFDGLLRRSFPITDFRFNDDGPTGFTFEGVASVVDHPYPVRDQFGEYTETIKAGAFDHTLRDKKAMVSLYVNHRHSDVPLATKAAGTLTLAADPHLRVRAALDPSRPDVQIIASAIRRGEMGEMSIGFGAVRSRDKWNDDWTEVVRTQVTLREASIVEAGANTGGTLASLRSFDDLMASLTDVEMDEADLRRAIAYFEAQLPELADTPVEPATADYSERDQSLRDRLSQYRLQAITA